MAFRILPTDAHLAEIHPRTQAYVVARKERERRRGPIGRFFGFLYTILVFGFIGILIYGDYRRTGSITGAFTQPVTCTAVLLIFIVGTYNLFVWRLELFVVRRLRRIKTNVKTWMQDDLAEQPPVIAPRPFRGDPRRN